MWFLSFIPDSVLQWFVHGVVALGLILTLGSAILNKIPVIKDYSKILGLLGLPILLAGIFFEGGYGVEMSWRAKANDMQAKIDAAQKESDDLKNQLTDKSKNNTVIITQKVTENAKQIEQKREVINTGCTINDDAWLLYNRAVAPKLPVSAGQPAAASR